MNCKVLVVAVVLALAAARTYPLYKQCDAQWGKEQLGTSSNTICSAGCLMSSVAMGLTGTGRSYNPSTLNTWLKGHGGYVSGDLFVWASVNPLGITYSGKIGNGDIQANINAGKIVILNVHNGGHWVLATGVSGSTVYVNDPGYNTASYTLSQIVVGQTSIFTPASGFAIFLNELEFILNVNNKRQQMMEASGGMLEQ